jgi:membrane associated rhomboid family serine protease
VTEPAADLDWHCYRHPDREAGVRCRRCERAICPDCMISAPVGFQCPSCVKGAPAVRTMRSLRADPYASMVLIAANVAVFLVGAGRSGQEGDLGLFGPAVADGEWWRIVTSGFLHFDLLHLAFNMLLLWWLGQMLEPTLGRVRFVLTYACSLLAGSLGALLLDPGALTGGASGAVFGLMAAAVLLMRRRGVDPMQSGLGGLLLINLLLTFLRPGISIGGHLGGLVGGALAALVLGALEDRPWWLASAGLAGLGGAVAAAGLWVAANPL